LPRPEVRHVPAAPSDGVGTLDDETSYVRERDPRRHGRGSYRGQAAGRPERSQPGTKKQTSIHDNMLRRCCD
jgi:hypothetical protein